VVSDRKPCHASSWFKADSGNVWKAHAADVDWQGGRWAVERMEGQRVDLGAAEAERP
jgi:hypothetical protein